MKKTTLAKTAAFALVIAALVASGIGIADAELSTTARASVANSLSFLSSGDLSVGSTGDRVTRLQGLLSELGYLAIPQGVAPGYFGSLTQRALQDYQRSLGLSATGMLDAATRNAVTTALTGRYPDIASALGAPTGSSQTANAPVSGSSSSTGSSLGYWYNGTWYPVASTAGGGYYSTNPSGSSLASTGSGSGYWYNGAWYSTSAQNIGGGESSDTAGNMGGYWQNGVWYPASQASPSSPATNASSGQVNYSTNLTPTGYWYNGTWYASVPTTAQAASSGVTGYWQNNVWYSTDGTQTTSYGNPNPTTQTGSGYWQNGVWYPTSGGSGSGVGGYWYNGVWYSTSSSNNTSGPGTAAQ